jgi:hypothetical protein
MAQHPSSLPASPNIDTFHPLGYPGYTKSEKISSLAFAVEELNSHQGGIKGEKVLLDKFFFFINFLRFFEHL